MNYLTINLIPIFELYQIQNFLAHPKFTEHTKIFEALELATFCNIKAEIGTKSRAKNDKTETKLQKLPQHQK